MLAHSPGLDTPQAQVCRVQNGINDTKVTCSGIAVAVVATILFTFLRQSI